MVPISDICRQNLDLVLAPDAPPDVREAKIAGLSERASFVVFAAPAIVRASVRVCVTRLY